MNIKAVLFDMDGLMVDTESLATEAFIHSAKKQGYDMTKEETLLVLGFTTKSIYAASKNAVNSLTRSWAKELGKLGVRVVGVAPGILEATGLRTLAYEEALAYTRGVTVEQIRAGYTSTKTTPLGRDGKLSEVADLVAYVASDRASYVHGVTYNVAGGKTRG